MSIGDIDQKIADVNNSKEKIVMSNTSRQIEVKDILAVAPTDEKVESPIIPSLFWLGGLKIDVVFDKNLYKTKKLVGEAQYPLQKIILDPTITNKQFTEQSFYHEMVHWILFMMSEDELRCNEKFVDLFAHFLYQARVTEQKEAVSGKESDVTIAEQRQ